MAARAFPVWCRIPLQSGDTPLHRAARKGHVEVVKALLAAPGILPNERNGVSPLAPARPSDLCMRGHTSLTTMRARRVAAVVAEQQAATQRVGVCTDVRKPRRASHQMSAALRFQLPCGEGLGGSQLKLWFYRLVVDMTPKLTANCVLKADWVTH